MTKRRDEGDPLPGAWLPDSVVPPREDRAYWDERAEQVMARAESVLERLRLEEHAPTWLTALTALWRPFAATGFALAASLVLAVLLRSPPSGVPDGLSIALTTVVSEGTPEALWRGAGVEADPVLALLAVQPARDPEGSAP